MTLSAVLTNKQLERLTFDLVQRTFAVCDEALQSAGCGVADIGGVLLVGGQSRSRFIRQAVETYFGRAAQSRISPDEAVALGAAIHAEQLVNRRGDAVLVDVTPLTLRVGTVGGLTEPIIPKNTALPVEQGKSFVTASDGQEKVRIRIYQGEHREAQHNEMLGEFSFSGFRRAPRGAIAIQVTFDIDASGLVNVRAMETESGIDARTEVTLSPQMTNEEIASLRQVGRR